MRDSPPAIEVEPMHRSWTIGLWVFCCVVCFLAIAFGAGYWLFNSVGHESTDASKYNAFLAEFPPEISVAAPENIPGDAINPILAYRYSGGGMGPSSTHMNVEFTVSPEDARRLLARAKGKLGAAASRRDDSEVVFERGDQVFELKIDTHSGAVQIRLANN